MTHRRRNLPVCNLLNFSMIPNFLMAAITFRQYVEERSVVTTPVLADVLYRGKNNYDIIRLMLATAVVFGHSYAISPNAHYKEPVSAYLKFEYIGSLAVYGFFLISGLFVTESYIKSNSLRKFATSRLLRIFPGLFGCLIVSAYVIGPLITKWNVAHYLGNPEVSSYVLSGMSLYLPGWYLPGVFESNTMTGVNGSIWTLVGEVFCYCCVAALGMLSLLRRPQLSTFIIVFAFVFLINKYQELFYFSAIPGFRLPFLYFMAGMVCAVLKKHIPIQRSTLGWLLACTVIAKLVDLNMFRLFFYTSFAYTIIYIGQSSLVRKIRLNHDVSYGVYLYGFVVQQTVESVFPLHNPVMNFFLSMPLILVLGFLSWIFVESPMIKLGSELNKLGWRR